MADSEDEYCGPGSDDDYVGFEGWKARTINDGHRKWGHGKCFDWLDKGECYGCGYDHPQLTLTATDAGVEARPKRLGPWCQVLERLKFKYQRDGKFLHATISPKDALAGLLCRGIKRAHLDLVGEGFKFARDIFDEQRIMAEMHEELANNPDANVLIHPSGIICARAGTDQATIDAAIALAAPAPSAPAPAPAPPPAEDDFDDEAALALIEAAEAAEQTRPDTEDGIDWDAVGAAADAAQADHDAKRARVL